MNRSFPFLACLYIALVLGSTAAVSISAQTDSSREMQTTTMRGIRKQRAISIAKNEARRRHVPLVGFRVIPCEQVEFWRIIFDGGGPEFLISKLTGKVLRVQTIPQSSARNRMSVGSVITKQQAINIAKKDVQQVYGPEGMDPEALAAIACEESEVWRVVFDYKVDPVPRSRYKLPPQGRLPNYVIDKGTGEIIFRRLD